MKFVSLIYLFTLRCLVVLLVAIHINHAPLPIFSAAAAALLSGADAFAPSAVSRPRATFAPLAMSAAAEAPAMADSGVPAEHAAPSESVADAEIPTNLPSDVGMDYVPLATMLATGQLAEADQVSWFGGDVIVNST